MGCMYMRAETGVKQEKSIGEGGCMESEAYTYTCPSVDIHIYI